MKNKISVAVLLLILGPIVPVILVVKSIQFDQRCGGYLKQAADANTPELAIQRLDVAIDYIEAHGLTNGYTSILWRTEDENVGFWYENIVACRDELQSCIESTQLEKTNVLMKVRESLTDNKEGNVSLTVPDGISKFPHNLSWAIWLTISIIMLIVDFFMWGYIYSEG